MPDEHADEPHRNRRRVRRRVRVKLNDEGRPISAWQTWGERLRKSGAAAKILAALAVGFVLIWLLLRMAVRDPPIAPSRDPPGHGRRACRPGTTGRKWKR
jgi:hypothetical protein